MTLLDAHGYEAVFGTPEGDTYRIPLICWREDEDHMYGTVLVKGHLRRTDQLRNFLQYDCRRSACRHEAPPAFEAPAVDSRPDGTHLSALR
ncbi:DUF6253 family protein [Kitasatospora sp. NPDC048296]|uniref:DUF6253 family protein n=1 Tax=Kitasatospora sp. NPDC048296 TaxID=3364048 RepID=UPI0037132136